MPFVKVNVLDGRSDAEKVAIGDAIQAALVSTLDVAEANRYQLFNEHEEASFRHTTGYLGLSYSKRLLVVEITMRTGDGDDRKQALLAEVNRNLVAAGVARPDDVFVLITEIGDADVSFGRGLSQRAPTPDLAA